MAGVYNMFDVNTLRFIESITKGKKKMERESSKSSYAKCYFVHIDNDRRRLSSSTFCEYRNLVRDGYIERVV